MEVGEIIYIIYSDTMLCSAIFDIISQTTKDVVCSVCLSAIYLLVNSDSISDLDIRFSNKILKN